MSRYVCLVHLDREKLRSLPRIERETLTNEALERLGASTLVTVRNGRLSAAEGPACPLAGLRFIEARDLNDAIRMAAKMPAARFGTVEVRPVLETEREEPL